MTGLILFSVVIVALLWFLNSILNLLYSTVILLIQAHKYGQYNVAQVQYKSSGQSILISCL